MLAIRAATTITPDNEYDMKKRISLLLVSLAFAASANAVPLNGSGFIETGPTGPTTIDEWYFTVTVAGLFNILVESESSDFLDSEINLFTAGGTFIENDDDGHTDLRSSFISRVLGIGSYVLYVSAYNFNNGEQGGPTHANGNFDNTGSIQNHGDYFLSTTGTGVAHLTLLREGNLNGTYTDTRYAVPEPGTLGLLALGLLGLGFAKRGRSRSA